MNPKETTTLSVCKQPLIRDSVKEDFRKIIYDHAKNFTKNKLNNV